jgi:hypothetical protein
VKSLIDKTHETDKGSLCDSRHTIEVGVTQDANGVIVPLQSYLLVGFTASDTSGGGVAEELLSALASAPLDSINWAGEKLADYSREKGVVYGEGAVGGFAKGYKETVDSAGSAVKKGWKKVKSWFAEEYDYSPLDYTPFNADEDGNVLVSKEWWTQKVTWSEFTGTAFHPANASAHKIRFQAWCSYEGKERKMFDSEISGCHPLVSGSECIACCDSTSFEDFLISSPGEWRVKVSSVATGSCASLDYEDEATFTVPTPEGWEPQPIYATLTSLSTDISQAVGFEVPPAYLAIGGSILIGGIAFKILRKKE